MKLIRKGPKVDSIINPKLVITCNNCESLFELRKNELRYAGMIRDEKGEWVSFYNFDCPICDNAMTLNSEDIKEAQDAAINKDTE